MFRSDNWSESDVYCLSVSFINYWLLKYALADTGLIWISGDSAHTVTRLPGTCAHTPHTEQAFYWKADVIATCYYIRKIYKVFLGNSTVTHRDIKDISQHLFKSFGYKKSELDLMHSSWWHWIVWNSFTLMLPVSTRHVSWFSFRDY